MNVFLCSTSQWKDKEKAQDYITLPAAVALRGVRTTTQRFLWLSDVPTYIIDIQPFF